MLDRQELREQSLGTNLRSSIESRNKEINQLKDQIRKLEKKENALVIEAAKLKPCQNCLGKRQQESTTTESVTTQPKSPASFSSPQSKKSLKKRDQKAESKAKTNPWLFDSTKHRADPDFPACFIHDPPVAKGTSFQTNDDFTKFLAQLEEGFGSKSFQTR